MEVSHTTGNSAPAFYNNEVGPILDSRIGGTTKFYKLIPFIAPKQWLNMDLTNDCRENSA